MGTDRIELATALFGTLQCLAGKAAKCKFFNYLMGIFRNFAGFLQAEVGEFRPRVRKISSFSSTELKLLFHGRPAASTRLDAAP